MEQKTHEIIAEWANLQNRWNNRNLLDLGQLQPEDDDPSVLFRNNWLANGQSFGLIASSGVGKSSLIAQMAFHWSMGDAFLADPIRPLNITIIQAEDSDRDLKEQRDGMIRGLLSEGWEMGRINEAISRVMYPSDFIGQNGEAFINMLTEYQHDCRRNLIIINPLQRFFGDDVSNQERVSHFCSKLDGIMKDRIYGCGMGIVMHTPKFHSGNKEARQSVDDYAEYAMAGSQEWTAWVRATINFQKTEKEEGYFYFKAAKRGSRLRWKNANGEPITKRVFRHSNGFIYWQEVTDPDELAAIMTPTVAKVGRAAKPILDVKKTAITISTQYTADAIGKTRDEFTRFFWEKNGKLYAQEAFREVFAMLVADSEKYGFRVEKTTTKDGKKRTTLQLNEF